jgi:hypothetical protein
MYAKIFTSIFSGSMRGHSDALLVFINLLCNADQDGRVDRHWQAIIDETGISERRVKAAIAELEAPDAQSRTRADDGRRLRRIDPEREWGWQVVNFTHYRAMRTAEDRREYARDYMRQRRAAKAETAQIPKENSDVNTMLTPVYICKQCQPIADAEAYAEADAGGGDAASPAAAARSPVRGPDPTPAPQPDPNSLTSLTAAVIGCRPEFRQLNVAAVENTFKAWPKSAWATAAADFIRDAANEMQCPPRPLKMLNGYLRKASERSQPSSAPSAPRQARQTPSQRFDASLRDAVAQYEHLHATRASADDFARLDSKLKDQYRDTLALPDAAGRKRYLIHDAREIAAARVRANARSQPERSDRLDSVVGGAK